MARQYRVSCAILLLSLVLGGYLFAASGEETTHTFDLLKFSMTCPADCPVKELEGKFRNVVAVILQTGELNGGFRAHLTISSSPNGEPPVDAQTFYLMNVDNRSQNPGFHMLDGGMTKRGGREAYQLIYTQNMAGQLVVKNMQIYIVEKGNVYVINYSADSDTYDTFLPVAERIARSFKTLP